MTEEGQRGPAVMAENPAGNRTRAERLAGDIADAILDGAFAPGFRLDEQLLAQRYGVSRTPVREALRQLAASGLIDMRPRRGAIVARGTPAELEALFVAMGEMEATCARLAAISMTPVERRRLQSLHDRMAELMRAGEPDPYAEANQGFHEAIYAGAHNAVLANFTAQLRRRLAPFRRAQFRTPGRLPRSHAEHETVVRAILSGDSAAAHAAMLHHVSLVEDAYDAFASASAA
jgi:DNA-binding GntR family transcriptional regulator